MTLTDIDPQVEADAMAEANALEPARFGQQGRGLAVELASDKLRSNLDTPVIITGDEEYAALMPGQKFIGPDRQERVKPYEVKGDIDFENVPEGAQFIGPDGELRQKPKYEGIGYTAQTLHSMALTDREKRKVLEKTYGKDAVHGDGENLYVIDEEGVYRKPGRMSDVRGAAGLVAGNIAPIGLGVVGSLVGAGIGTAAAPGPGTFGGGAVGGATGGLLGQRFNDVILQLNGVYDRTPGERLANEALGVGASVGGDLAARGVAAFVPSVKAGVSKAQTAAPDFANKILGTNAEDLARARRIAELGEGERKGLSVPLPLIGKVTGTSTGPGSSTFAPGAPYLQMLQETMHEKFTTEGTRRRAANRTYEKEVEPLVESMAAGKQLDTVDDFVGPPTKEAVRGKVDEFVGDDLISPPAATSGRQAGELLQERALREAQILDAQFAAELAARRQAIETGAAPEIAQREQIQQIAQERHRNASQLIDAAMSDVARNADEAVRAAAAGSNSGGLWQRVGEQLLHVKQALTARYGNNAREAFETVPRGVRIRTDELVGDAEEFMAQLPEEFAARNPTLIRRIRALGRRPNPEYQAADEATGAPAVGERFLPPESLTLAELHQLRTDLREVSDYHDLPSSFRNFATKQFGARVDQLMHSVADTSQFRTAIRLLDENDAWYAQERPIFNAREMQAVVRGLETGEPADPELLFKALVKPGHTDMIARAREVVGPNLWTGVQGAQTSRWLQAARAGQFDNTVSANKFADEILDAYQDGPNGGTLFAVQGPERGQQLLTLAQQIAALRGDLPVTYRPGDTAFDIFRQAHVARQQADSLAARDPLTALQQDLRRLDIQARREQNQRRSQDPLNFLYNQSYGANQAVDRILNNEDLILAVANRFGEHSREFNALRQVWMERVFKGDTNPGKGLGKATPEIQRLMMGVNMDTARKIAEDMEFIMGSKALRGGGDDGGQSIAAASRLTHPLGGRVMSRVGRVVPGANAAARATWQAYFDTLDRVMSSPATLRFLEKSYSGGAEQRQAIRNILARHLQKAGAMGTGGGMGLYEVGGEPISLPQ